MLHESGDSVEVFHGEEHILSADLLDKNPLSFSSWRDIRAGRLYTKEVREGRNLRHNYQSPRKLSFRESLEV